MWVVPDDRRAVHSAYSYTLVHTGLCAAVLPSFEPIAML